MMKKTLIGLALGGMSALATAQTSVQVYGIVDLNVGKDVGVSSTRMSNGTVSRIGFKGTEDLGNGMSAFFDLLHRFNPDTGQNNGGTGGPTGPFWAGGSLVGLSGNFGKLMLGRAVAESAMTSQILPDPWFWDNVTSSYPITSGAIGHVWYNNAVSYEYSQGGFSLGLQVADTDSNSLYGTTTKRPVNGGMRYAAGAYSFGISHEKTGEADARWTTVDASAALGQATIHGLIGVGRNAASADVKSVYVSGKLPVGAVNLLAAYGRVRTADVTTTSKLSFGAYYGLSKRTSLYTNLAHDDKAASSKVGYELGLRHTF
ncbi:porin [Herbaspirillum sp. GCM10030257]|uniref:porin n=1 Tax=Herbaspirillum sp. GCM10030257 TaxID=3273393 RepID=UPI0036131137